MKLFLFLMFCLSLGVVNGLSMAVDLPFADHLPVITLALAVCVAVSGWAAVRGASAPVSAPEPSDPGPPLPPAVSRDERTRHELAAFLGILQEKGRLVDFVMEDLNAQPDARVGQVARVVHQGCREVIVKAFAPEPLETSVAEGEILTLPEGYAPDEYRLIGTVTGESSRGRLLHRGWVAKTVKLPEFAKEPPSYSGAYRIAPAEVERI